MPTTIPLGRQGRVASKEADETASALQELRRKREQQKLKQKRLNQQQNPSEEDDLADWSDDDAPTFSAAATPPKKERARLQRATKEPSPVAPSDDIDDLVGRLGSLSIPSKQKHTPNRAAPVHSPQAVSPAAASPLVEITISDSDSESDGAEASPAVEKVKASGSTSDDFTLDNGQFKLQAKVANRLYPHQVEGIKWLWSLYKLQRGGILGDDMGLGKTLQCASFIAGMFNSRKAKRVLVVAPLTLLTQWQKEFQVCGIGHLVHEYYGTATNKREASLRNVMRDRGVVLTTYGMVLHNAAALQQGPSSRNDDDDFQWDLMMLDEGHKVKNPGTKQYKALKEVPVAVRVIVTGTPIQNNLTEMHALYDLCTEDLLGSKSQFRTEFERPITAGQDKGASERERQVGAARAAELRKIIGPYFLRREKKETLAVREHPVDDDKEGEDSLALPSDESAKKGGEGTSKGAKPAAMPHKNDLVIWLQLKPLQERIYKAFLSSSAVKRALNLSDSPLAAITVLKKIADHPALLSKRAADMVVRGTGKWAGGGVGSEDDSEDELSDSDDNSLADFIVDDSDSDEGEGRRRRKEGKKGAKKGKKPASKAAEDIDLPAVGDIMSDVWGEDGNLEDSLVEGLEQRGVDASCKTAFVLELLRELKEKGHRTLVFSQSRVMLDILEAAVRSEGMSICRVDGSLSKREERQAEVDRFQNTPSIPVFLLTSQVGGLGLTITAADRVIILDPAWNPAVDNQSVDRAYRIGQKRDVVVYRLITCGTVEEKIYKRQVFKGGLSKTGTEEGIQFRYFSNSDLRDLFAITPEGLLRSETQQELHSMHAQHRRASPQLLGHLERIEAIAGCAGISDHDLLFSTKAAAEKPLSPASAAALKDGSAARVPYNRGRPQGGNQVPNADELSAMMAAHMKLNVGPEPWEVAETEAKRLQEQIASMDSTIRLAMSLPDGGAKIIQRKQQLLGDLADKKAQVVALRSKHNHSLLTGLTGLAPAPPHHPPSTLPPTASTASTSQAALYAGITSTWPAPRASGNPHPSAPRPAGSVPGAAAPLPTRAGSSSTTATYGRASGSGSGGSSGGSGGRPVLSDERSAMQAAMSLVHGMLGGAGTASGRRQSAPADPTLLDITNSKRASGAAHTPDEDRLNSGDHTAPHTKTVDSHPSTSKPTLPNPGTSSTLNPKPALPRSLPPPAARSPAAVLGAEVRLNQRRPEVDVTDLTQD